MAGYVMDNKLIGRKVRRTHPAVSDIVMGEVYTISKIDPRMPPRITVSELEPNTWFLFHAFEVLDECPLKT